MGSAPQARRRALALCMGLSLASIPLPGCGPDSGTTQSASKSASETNVRPIDKVLESHTTELMGIPGVVGVYQGALEDGTPCITVMVVKSTPELEALTL